MEIVHGFQLLTIFAKRSILDVWRGAEYVSTKGCSNLDQGSSINYVRKIFRKTNICNPLIRTRMGLEILVFWNILRTYLMDDLQLFAVANNGYVF